MIDTIGSWFDNAQWGDVSSWFAAIGTVGALVVALALLGREAKRDKHRADERRAYQASQIAAWVEHRQSATAEGHGATGPGLFCVVQNTSPLPVYDVILHFRDYSDEGRRSLATDPLHILPPGQLLRMLPATVSANPADHKALRVLVSFVDTNGRRWRRTHDGTLIDRGPATRGDPPTDSAEGEAVP